MNNHHVTASEGTGRVGPCIMAYCNMPVSRPWGFADSGYCLDAPEWIPVGGLMAHTPDGDWTPIVRTTLRDTY